MKIAVVTDSSCGMSVQQGLNTDIFILPLQVTIDGETKLEGETILVDEVYEYVAKNADVKTSLPPLGRIEELFRQLKAENYDLIFALPICNGLSGTINAMRLAAEEINMPFDYIDCYSTFSNQLYLVQKAKTLFNEGYSVDDVKKKLIQSCDDSVTIIVPNDLQHLARGGRLTPMAAKLGGLLKIKPMLYLNKDTSGRIDSLSKVRTMRKAMLEIVEYLKQHNVDEKYLITVGHVADEAIGREFYDIIRTNFPKCEVLYTQIVSVVGVHTGIGCIGLQYIRRIDS